MADVPMTAASPDHEWEPFRCDIEPDRDHVRVLPVGALDMSNVGEVEQRLRELQQAGFREVVLDLRELTFLDSSGLRLILTTDSLARRDGTSFVLIAGPPAVQRVFEVVGVLDSLPFGSAEADRNGRPRGAGDAGG